MPLSSLIVINICFKCSVCFLYLLSGCLLCFHARLLLSVRNTFLSGPLIPFLSSPPSFHVNYCSHDVYQTGYVPYFFCFTSKSFAPRPVSYDFIFLLFFFRTVFLRYLLMSPCGFTRYVHMYRTYVYRVSVCEDGLSGANKNFRLTNALLLLCSLSCYLTK
jgi:hypothetical protein